MENLQVPVCRRLLLEIICIFNFLGFFCSFDLIALSRTVLPRFAKIISRQALWSLMTDCDLDSSCLPVLVAHEPSPTSVHNLSHWNQSIRRFVRGKISANRVTVFI